MKRLALALIILLCSVAASADDPPRCPHIFGIAQVTVLTTQPRAAQDFYSGILRIMQPTNCAHCDEVLPKIRYSVNHAQEISLNSTHDGSQNLIAEIVFATDEIPALRRYFEYHKIAAIPPGKPYGSKAPGIPLTVSDPEGHRISFVQWTQGMPAVTPETLDQQEIIHAGFIVKDRAAEDAFYKDILGFHVYWHGGMKDGTDDWVDMQVPDGTDWLEYMLNAPANPDQHTRGVLDHVAIGVHDIHATYDELVARGVKISEKPQIGRDGKWQLNLYDPNQTRVEFMERKPAQEPCCSPYQGPHPGEQPPAKAHPAQ